MAPTCAWWGHAVIVSVSRACLRRLWLELVAADRPWDQDVVDLNHPTLKLLIEQAEAAAELEIGAMVCWSYSRDRVVERRELSCESAFKKYERLARAAKDRERASLER